MKYYNDIDKELARLTNYGVSFDVVRKEFGDEKKVVLYFLSSLASSRSVFELNYSIMNMNEASFLSQLMPGSVEEISDVYKAFIAISSGMSVVIYKEKIYVIETREYPTRSVSEPDTEKTIRGSRDGFTENIIINVGLIRRRIRSEYFECEITKVGTTSKSDIAICSLSNKVNENVLKKVKEQISKLDIDGLTMSDRALEERLFKQGLNPFPLVRYSERPDVVAAQLFKGHIAIVVDTSSSVIILPTTIFEHTKHIEEYRQVSVVGSFIRIIRHFAILISIFLVPIWMLTLNNENFISNIFVKIENVSSVPVLVQILLVEITIEILRIATIHTPNQLSSAMGLIATLILGQMAVEIGWFASEVLLFCSISAIGGFATPSYELSLANKMVKIFLIMIVGLLGGSGFIIGIYFFVMLLASVKMFDVPYLYPLFPFDFIEFRKVVFRGVSKS